MWPSTLHRCAWTWPQKPRDGRWPSIELLARPNVFNQLVGTYTAQLDSMLVKSWPFNNLRLQGVINFRDEHECQCLNMLACISISLSNEYRGYLQHRCRWNAMRQQIIKSFPNLQYPRRRSLCYYIIRNHRDERLPIRRRNWSFIGYFLTASSPILACSHQIVHGRLTSGHI